MADEDARLVERRIQAVRDYVAGCPVKVISKETAIPRQEIHRLMNRCMAEHSDGHIWGFRALVKGCHIKTYVRTAPINGSRPSQHGGAAGALTMLFDQYPRIREAVDIPFLKKIEAGVIHESRMPIKVIHKCFIDKCKETGLKAKDYPFNMSHRGKRALTSYLRRLLIANLKTAVQARHGDEAARALASADAGPDSIITRPYERVEFDGHRIDLFCTIDLPNPYGGIQRVTLNRLWLLVIIDVKTRAILGYSLVLNPEYNSEDVLRCVKHALTPWKPMTLTIPGLRHTPGSGLPSGVFTECEWALWDELWFDNAKANLAEAVRSNLTRVIGCHINAGPVKTPQRRPFIERLFQTLEENGFHRLPSTTGSGPNDSRRDDPEAAALRLNISYQHLVELVDVLIARYNAEPHSGLGNRSPLEMLEYLIVNQGYEIRTLPEHKRQDLALLNIRVVRCIRGDLKEGKCPYVEFEGVRYYNDLLRRSADLIGHKLSLLVDPDDLRCIRAYFEDGREFGVLTAHGLWGRTPHSLTVRKAINTLRLRKLIFYTDSDDPILVYMKYLSSRAATNKRAAGQSAMLQTVLLSDSSPSPTSSPADEPESDLPSSSRRGYTPVMRKTRLV
ncbi:MAG: Mu transposase C-terminal domain-containing protein [Nitrospira sp.]|nr:Mu transposase C-terminal domain-containing protein [Nitrospira sp.]